MKNLFVMSFFALMAGMFIVSCNVNEETIASQDSVKELPSVIQNKAIMLPIGYDDEEAIMSYLENVTQELTTKLELNHKIASFLFEISKYEEVRITMQHGMHFADLDLSSVLTQSEMTDLERFSPPQNADERVCNSSTYWCYTRFCCEGPGHSPICWVIPMC